MNESSQKPAAPKSSSYQPAPRADASSSAAQQQAAAAALARLEKHKEPTPQQRSAALIRAQALKELELEQQQKANIGKLTLDEKNQPSSSQNEFAVTGVFYKCPLIGK